MTKFMILLVLTSAVYLTAAQFQAPVEAGASENFFSNIISKIFGRHANTKVTKGGNETTGLGTESSGGGTSGGASGTSGADTATSGGGTGTSEGGTSGGAFGTSGADTATSGGGTGTSGGGTGTSVEINGTSGGGSDTSGGGTGTSGGGTGTSGAGTGTSGGGTGTGGGAGSEVQNRTSGGGSTIGAGDSGKSGEGNIVGTDGLKKGVGIAETLAQDKINFDKAMASDGFNALQGMKNGVQGIVNKITGYHEGGTGDLIKNRTSGGGSTVGAGDSGKSGEGNIVGTDGLKKGVGIAETLAQDKINFDKAMASDGFNALQGMKNGVQGIVNKFTGRHEGGTGDLIKHETSGDATKNAHVKNLIEGIINKVAGGAEEGIRRAVSSAVNNAVEDVIDEFGGWAHLGGLTGQLKDGIASAISSAVTNALGKFVGQLGKYDIKSLGSVIVKEIMTIVAGAAKGAVEGVLVGAVIGGIKSGGLGVPPQVNIHFGGNDVPL